MRKHSLTDLHDIDLGVEIEGLEAKGARITTCTDPLCACKKAGTPFYLYMLKVKNEDIWYVAGLLDAKQYTDGTWTQGVARNAEESGPESRKLMFNITYLYGVTYEEITADPVYWGRFHYQTYNSLNQIDLQAIQSLTEEDLKVQRELINKLSTSDNPGFAAMAWMIERFAERLGGVAVDLDRLRKGDKEEVEKLRTSGIPKQVFGDIMKGVQGEEIEPPSEEVRRAYKENGGPTLH